MNVSVIYYDFYSSSDCSRQVVTVVIVVIVVTTRGSLKMNYFFSYLCFFKR